MSFLADNEHIVILSYAKAWQGGAEFTTDDLRGLHDVGVQTVMCYTNWHMIEPQFGVYDWSSIETMVEPVLAAGLKAIVKVGAYMVPTFFPPEWYVRNDRGLVMCHAGVPNDQGLIPLEQSGCLSYWQPDAWAYQLGFIEQVCRHFAGAAVECINIAPANGEGLMFGLGKGFCFDDAALASFRAFMGDEHALPDTPVPGTPTLAWLRKTIIPAQIAAQRIYVSHYGEYWTMLHHAFETIPATGNWLIDDLYYALHAALPGAEHWGLCYTVFRQGETRGLWGPEQDVQRHGVKMLVAAEGCEGLIRNTDKAIAMGMRGMFAGPLLPYAGTQIMEPWKFDAIRDAVRKWEAVQ